MKQHSHRSGSATHGNALTKILLSFTKWTHQYVCNHTNKDPGLHVTCKLLKVGFEVVLIGECVVIVVEGSDEVDILFIFDECCREFCFPYCDLRTSDE